MKKISKKKKLQIQKSPSRSPVMGEKLGKIFITSMRDLDMCELTMETDDATFDTIAEIGKEMIGKDKQECFGYVVKKAISETISQESKK